MTCNYRLMANKLAFLYPLVLLGFPLTLTLWRQTLRCCSEASASSTSVWPLLLRLPLLMLLLLLMLLIVTLAPDKLAHPIALAHIYTPVSTPSCQCIRVAVVVEQAKLAS